MILTLEAGKLSVVLITIWVLQNLAARHASGEYLMFMDDDNVAKPFEVETFVTAALNSGADVLTTPSDLIFGEEFPSPFRKMTHCWLPLGSI